MSVQKKLFGFLYFLCVLVAFASPVLADDAAQTAYENGHYEEALRLWDAQAKKGNSRAQNQLGEMYRNGIVLQLSRGMPGRNLIQISNGSLPIWGIAGIFKLA